MNKLRTIFLLSLPILVIWGSYEIEKYRFNDCKKVGHGTFYCILNMGK